MEAPFKLTREFINQLNELIEVKNDLGVKELLYDLHPADLAEIINHLENEEQKYVLLLLDESLASDTIAEFEDAEQGEILEDMPSEILAKRFIDNMDSDDAADLLSNLTEEKQEEVLSHMDDFQQAGDIADLLNYDEDTAGGLMGKELIEVNENWTIAQCISEIRRQAEEIEDVYYVYVINDDHLLKGTLPLKRLILHDEKSKILDVCKTDIITAKVDDSAEEVAHMMEKYNLVAIPVIDKVGRLMGRITIDDVVDVIREEADKDYQMISGLAEDVQPNDGVWLMIRARLPWLFIGLFGGILGAKVIGLYEHDLTMTAALAFFIPLIAAMGGNVGVQSSAIIVQSLANKSIQLESTGKKIGKELSVAMLNGLALSGTIFLFNLIFSTSFALTLIVSIALFIVIIIASVLGTFVPLALNRFNIDPALATGPFITTLNDILGLFVYLSVGRYILSIM